MKAVDRTVAAMARHSELDVNAIFDQALAEICIALPESMACLHLVDGDDQALNLVASHGLDPVRIHSWAKLSADGSTAQAMAMRRGEAVERGRAELTALHLAGLACLPLDGYDVKIGVLSVLWPTDAAPGDDPDRLAFLSTMGRLLAVAIEHYGLVAEMIDNLSRIMELKSLAEARSNDLDDLNKRLRDANHRLTELSITDGLTSLFNHRYTHQRLEEEIRRCQRSETPLSLIMADLDHFKRLNDRLGHLAGDEALRLFAGWLRECVRGTDLLGRLGGEEFVAVLLDCPLDQALLVAEKIRRTTQAKSQAPPFEAIGGFTVSLGVAQWRPGQEAGQLLDAADKALYQAKERGRNKICAAPID